MIRGRACGSRATPSRWLWAIGLLGALALNPPSSHAQSLLQVVPDTVVFKPSTSGYLPPQPVWFINTGQEVILIDSLWINRNAGGAYVFYIFYPDTIVQIILSPDPDVLPHLPSPIIYLEILPMDTINVCIEYFDFVITKFPTSLNNNDFDCASIFSSKENVTFSSERIIDTLWIYQRLPVQDTLLLFLDVTEAGSVGVEENARSEATLQAYPQPFREQVRLALSARRAGLYEVVIWDVLGREQARWRYRMVPGARREWSWRAGASGVYLVGIFRDGRLLTFQTLVQVH